MMGRVPLLEEEECAIPLSLHHVRMVADSEKVAVCRPGRRLSPGTQSTSTLIWDFPDLITARNKCLKNCLSNPVCFLLLQLESE